MWTTIDTPIGQTNYYKQDQKTTCTVACGLMMLKALSGKEIDESRLIADLNKTTVSNAKSFLTDGYTLEQLVTVLTSNIWRLGIRTQKAKNGEGPRNLCVEVLKKATMQKPAILSVASDQFAHAVLAIGSKENKGRDFVILDPQFEMRIVPFDVLPVYPLPDKGYQMTFGEQAVISW